MEHARNKQSKGGNGARSGVRPNQGKRSKAIAGGTASDSGLSSQGTSTASKRTSKAVKRASAPLWVKDLRKGIRDDNGAGWSVRLPPGKSRIQVQWEWGTRQERERCNLPNTVQWEARQSLRIRNIIKQLHDLLEEKQDLGLRKAIEILFRQEDPGSSSKVKSFPL